MVDIDSDEISVLPPHFSSTNPMDDNDMKEATQLMYPKILERYENTKNDTTGILLRVLSSIIYHNDWIKEAANKTAGCPFLCIPLLHNPELLIHLKEK